MKREIKFRIYDKKENKYFEPIYEAWKGKLLDLSITLSGEIIRRTLEMPAEHESMFPERYVIQSYIGITDKFDVEIYEGDILQAEHGLCIVVWEDISWAVKSPGSEAIDYENRMFFENCSVVGNIHDDAELLEDAP